MIQERTSTVHGKECNPVGGHVVQSMRIGIGSHEFEAMIVRGEQCCLQAVVSRTVNVRKVVYETKKRKLSRKRLRASCWVRLIAVNNAGKLHSMVPDVGGIEREPARKSVLNTQRPIFYVRGAEIALHGKGIAGSRVATLNQASDAGRINCCGLISPWTARRGGSLQVEGDTGGDNVSGASTASGGRTGGVQNGCARRNGPHTERDGILSVLLRHECAHVDKTINSAAYGPEDGGTLA